MTEEELFCKLFPEYVVNGKPLSPYFDLFESGYEQSEKRIEELEAQIEKMKCCLKCSHYYSLKYFCDKQNTYFGKGYSCNDFQLNQ